MKKLGYALPPAAAHQKIFDSYVNVDSLDFRQRHRAKDDSEMRTYSKSQLGMESMEQLFLLMLQINFGLEVWYRLMTDAGYKWRISNVVNIPRKETCFFAVGNTEILRTAEPLESQPSRPCAQRGVFRKRIANLFGPI